MLFKRCLERRIDEIFELVIYYFNKQKENQANKKREIEGRSHSLFRKCSNILRPFLFQCKRNREGLRK